MIERCVNNYDMQRENGLRTRIRREFKYLANADTDKNLNIRLMNDEDAVALSAIEQEVFSMPWTVNDFLEMNAHDEVAYLVAEYDGEIIGGCGVRNVLGDGEITNVVIKEKFRGRGYAKCMLEKLFELGRSLGAKDFTLEVRVSNEPAIKLYESFGFVSEGIRPNFYEKPVEDANIMWLRG